MAVATTTLGEGRIPVQRAAEAAMQYFRELFPGAWNFGLEEVELSEDGQYWLVTLSCELKTNPANLPQPLDFLLLPQTKFKLFKVNARTGEIVAMKMRSPE